MEVRPLVPASGAAPLFGALNDDAVQRHVAGRPASAEAYAASLQERLDAGWFPWLLQLRVPHAGPPPGTVVGTSSYCDASVPDARLEIGATACGEGGLGDRRQPRHTKLLLLGYGFEVLHVGRVQLKTDVRNVRSQRAIAGLGATYEGTLRRFQRRSDGTVRDTVLFSVVAEEWPAVRRRLLARLDGEASAVTAG